MFTLIAIAHQVMEILRTKKIAGEWLTIVMKAVCVLAMRI
jgi:hypothetical protein